MQPAQRLIITDPPGSLMLFDDPTMTDCALALQTGLPAIYHLLPANCQLHWRNVHDQPSHAAHRYRGRRRLAPLKLGGEVNGTPGHPALLQQVTVAPGASLSHVTLGFGVVLPPDAVIGDGVLVLTLVHTPDGRGTVTSTPAGIDGGPDCQHAFDFGLTVVLTATPADSATAFDAWSGDCTGTEPTCSLTMTAAREVTATFKSGMKLFFPFVRFEYVDE